MNPNDIFWLARYAHNQLTPLMEPLGADLKLNLNFGGPFPGLDIWTHHADSAKSKLLPYKLVANSQIEIEEFATKLRLLASATA